MAVQNTVLQGQSARGGEEWEGALPHSETADEQKLQLGPRLATSGETVVSVLQISLSYKEKVSNILGGK